MLEGDDVEQKLAKGIRGILRYEPDVVVKSSGRFGLSDFNIRGMNKN